MIAAALTLLPLGIGIALNPLAVVAGILLLASVYPLANSIAFVTGWIASITLLFFLALTVYQGFNNPVADLLNNYPKFQFLIGVIIVAIALRALLMDREPAEELPRWARSLNTINPPRSLGMGAFLATFSLRNIALIIAAASILRQARISGVDLLVVFLVFLAIATSGIVAPMLVHRFGADGAKTRLDEWRSWLILHMNTIASLTLVIIGLLVIRQAAS